MRIKNLQIVIFLLFLSFVSKAQLQRLDIPLQKTNGIPYKYAWAGGLNNPQFSEVDFDNDGIKDLFIFDRAGNVVIPFLNGGTALTIDYSFAPEWKNRFPGAVERFVLLRDYNCDGIEDLFAYFRDESSGETGMSVYKASRDGSGGIQYQIEKPLLRYTDIGQNFPYNLYMSNIDLPDVNDIDGDGDLDILNFHIGGGYVQLFNNTSIENGWGCDSLRFEIVDDCWGRFYESGISTALDLSPNTDSCANWAGWTALRSANSDPRHAGSTLLSLDMDNDNVKELLLGDIAFNNLVLVLNGGNADTAFAVGQQTNFPANTTPVAITAFPAAFYVDIDNDNKKDLIAAPNADDISVNDRVSWLYLNNGTTTQPVFNFEQQDFIVGEMLDVGATAAPAFVDFNGDGLLDLVVGNYGVFVNAGTYRTRLIAFENVGTATAPVFRLVNQDFAGLQQYNLRRMVPTFGDLDNDGDKDIIIGLEDGTLLYVSNTGTASNATFATPLANYSGIDAGQHAAPQLIDLNRDGKLDLVIGERNGNSNYYENKGTAALPTFYANADNQALGLIDTRVLAVSLEGNSAPFIWDEAGDYRLFMGNEAGQVWVYDSIEGNLSGAFRRLYSGLDEISEGRQSILAMADINSDGQPEIVVGNKRGGLALFTAPVPSSSHNLAEINNFECNIWPNPATQRIFLSFSDVLNKEADFVLSDALGRIVFSQKLAQNNSNFSIDLPELADALYFASINQNGKIATYKILIKR